MFGLQEFFDEHIREQLRPEKMGIQILENELEEIGLYLSKKQRANLVNQIKNLGEDSQEFNLSPKQLRMAYIFSEQEFESKINEILQNLEKKVAGFAENIE